MAHTRINTSGPTRATLLVTNSSLCHVLATCFHQTGLLHSYVDTVAGTTRMIVLSYWAAIQAHIKQITWTRNFGPYLLRPEFKSQNSTETVPVVKQSQSRILRLAAQTLRPAVSQARVISDHTLNSIARFAFLICICFLFSTFCCDLYNHEILHLCSFLWVMMID